jgi:hypothetical protein
VRTRLGITSLLCALLGVLSGTTAAFASTSPITLSGNFEHRSGPGSGASGVALSVDATLSGEATLGTLDYAWKGEHDWYRFYGTVTCVRVDSRGVSVGAVGKEEEEPIEGPPETTILPGTYTELLTAAFGEFANEFEEFGPPLTSTYHVQEAHHEGPPGAGEPSCAKASLAHRQEVPVPYGLTLTPTVVSPEDGYVAPKNAVTFRGIGEAGKVVQLFEDGETAPIATTTVGANGRWHIHLTDMRFGAHSFHTSMEADPANVSSSVEIHIPAP